MTGTKKNKDILEWYEFGRKSGSFFIVLSFTNGIFSPDPSIFSSNYISISLLRGLPLLSLFIEMFYLEASGLLTRDS